MEQNTSELLLNFRKIFYKYQEVLTYLVSYSSFNTDYVKFDLKKSILIFSSLQKEFLINPEHSINLFSRYQKKFQRLISSIYIEELENNNIIYSSKRDKRFKDSLWQEIRYFNFIKQFYLMCFDFKDDIISKFNLPVELTVYFDFLSKQFLNAIAPSNFILTNPVVLKETLDTCGKNLLDGLENLLSDFKDSKGIFQINTTNKKVFSLGKNIAATKGKIVFKNDLIELICYKPRLSTYSIPLLIIPPCINKYYILDLSKENSLVSFLIQNNFQVFIISWINPTNKVMQKKFEDYLKLGILDACHFILDLGYRKINALGYCIGGTMLAIVASYIKTHNLDYFNSLTFLTTLLDFMNPGELSVFINNELMTSVKEQIKLNGFFDGRYLSIAFSLLRANDLIWSFFVNNYLLGKKPIPHDILYWNSDTINLSASMYYYYLRNIYQKNLLKVPQGLCLLNTNIDLKKIDCNTFFLAAEEDHIAPWASVYEGLKLIDGKKTFCLTSAGHVAGIVNPPSYSKYNYKISNQFFRNSTEWVMNAKTESGSWWNYWLLWLKENSDSKCRSLDYMSINSFGNSPGNYVRE